MPSPNRTRSDDPDLVVDVVGTVVAIHAPDSVARTLRDVLVDLEVDRPATRQLVIESASSRELRLLDDGVEVRNGITAAIAPATIVWWLNAIAIDHSPHLLVHSACVARAGAVLLPGRSGAGKSTLAAACLEDGMSYASDEYAALDLWRGTLVPYPRPLELDTGLVAASALGAERSGALAPTGIVFPRFEAGAPFSVTELDLQGAFLGLLAHTANHERLGGRAIQWLTALAGAGRAMQVTYSETSAARLLVAELAERPGERLRPPPIIGPITPSTTTVALGDDLVVFDATTGRVHVLNPAASLVWLDVGRTSDRGTTGDSERGGFARHALAPEAIDATLRRLAATGLLP